MRVPVGLRRTSPLRALVWLLIAMLSASCSGTTDATPVTEVSRAELERRLSEASSEKERGLLAIRIAEREIVEANHHTETLRSRLAEARSKEQVVSTQLAERLVRLEIVEQDLAAARARIAAVEKEAHALAVLEVKIGESRERRGALEKEVGEAAADLARLEMQVAKAQEEFAARRAALDAELGRLVKGGELILATLRATEEVTSRPSKVVTSVPSTAGGAGRR